MWWMWYSFLACLGSITTDFETVDRWRLWGREARFRRSAGILLAELSLTTTTEQRCCDGFRDNSLSAAAVASAAKAVYHVSPGSRR